MRTGGGLGATASMHWSVAATVPYAVLKTRPRPRLRPCQHPRPRPRPRPRPHPRRPSPPTPTHLVVLPVPRTLPELDVVNVGRDDLGEAAGPVLLLQNSKKETDLSARRLAPACVRLFMGRTRMNAMSVL